LGLQRHIPAIDLDDLPAGQAPHLAFAGHDEPLNVQRMVVGARLRRSLMAIRAMWREGFGASSGTRSHLSLSHIYRRTDM
jgi:hypothetical protein